MSTPEPDAIQSSVPLGYATPAAGSGGSPTRAAAVIAFSGLALIVLGGCFLIGVMGVTQSTFTAQAAFLEVVLYLLAFACFAGAAFCLYVGLKRLIQLAMRE